MFAGKHALLNSGNIPCKLARLPNYLPAIYAHHTLQSWTKSIEICTFLPTERLFRGFGTAMAPPLPPPWSNLFIRDPK